MADNTRNTHEQSIFDLETQIDILNIRYSSAQLELDLTKRRAELYQKKYEQLANSRLGRTVIRFQRFRAGLYSAKRKGGIRGMIRWLLNRSNTKASLPPAQAMKDEQQFWVNQYLDQITQVPNSNGCRYYERSSLRIGLICDEFFYQSIEAAADFVYVTPDSWRATVEEGLDAFLFVTPWRGLNREWNGIGRVRNMESNPLRLGAIELLDTCRSKGIPTIFYSKEDPPNYDVFLDFAKHCDYICTTAQECVPLYQRDCGHDRVQAVGFGINPVIHNPIGFRVGKKEPTVLFSGSWMMKYPDRCAELSVIFDGVLQSSHQLHIVDRNYPETPRYYFPEPYFQLSSPALPHILLQKVHKLFNWAININSVKGSHTMFANRTYELQANGILLLSNQSIGVNEKLPLVQMIHDSAEVARVLDAMSDEECYERQVFGIRSVMGDDTCFQRIAQIFAPLGISLPQPERKILVLAEAITESVQSSFDRQSYPHKTLRLAGQCTAEDLSSFDMVTWFAPDAQYGIFYLEDMANGFKYTACDYITKDAWLEGQTLHEGVEHNYVSGAVCKYRTLFWVKAYDPERLWNLPAETALRNGYSIDHFGYNAAPAPVSAAVGAPELTVILPVKDNGLHLYGKAFASLRRSSLFDSMEILLADMGSQEPRTRQVEQYLVRRHGNVRLIPCGETLGDALNRCLSHAEAPFAAVLFAGDEAVGDGYAPMLAALREQGADVAMGKQYYVAAQTKTVDVSKDVPFGTLPEHEADRLNAMVFTADALKKLAAGEAGDLKVAPVAQTVSVHYHD